MINFIVNKFMRQKFSIFIEINLYKIKMLIQIIFSLNVIEIMKLKSKQEYYETLET